MISVSVVTSQRVEVLLSCEFIVYLAWQLFRIQG